MNPTKEQIDMWETLIRQKMRGETHGAITMFQDLLAFLTHYRDNIGLKVSGKLETTDSHLELPPVKGKPVFKVLLELWEEHPEMEPDNTVEKMLEG